MNKIQEEKTLKKASEQLNFVRKIIKREQDHLFDLIIKHHQNMYDSDLYDRCEHVVDVLFRFGIIEPDLNSDNYFVMHKKGQYMIIEAWQEYLRINRIISRENFLKHFMPGIHNFDFKSSRPHYYRQRKKGKRYLPKKIKSKIEASL